MKKKKNNRYPAEPGTKKQDPLSKKEQKVSGQSEQQQQNKKDKSTKFTTEQALQFLKTCVSFSATGNYHGKIMHAKSKSGLNIGLDKINMAFTALIGGAIGMYFAFIKPSLDANAQVMVISGVKEESGFLSIFGFCTEWKKRTPMQGEEYEIMLENIDDGKRKLRNIIARCNIYYQDIAFYRDYPFLDKEKHDYYSLLQQSIVWMANDDFTITNFINYFKDDIGKDISQDYLIDLLMLPLYIIKESQYEISDLKYFKDLIVFLEFLLIIKQL